MMTFKLAVQMFTVRDFVKTRVELAETLRKISDIGYAGVQFSAVGAISGEDPEVSATEARQLLDDSGLVCCATHRSWDDLVNNTQKEIDFHKTIGCDLVGIGSIPWDLRQQGIDGFRKWLSDAVPVVAQLKKVGIRFAYHNHDFEFERFGPGRISFFDLILKEGVPDLNVLLDIYWAEHAGFNPIRVIEKLPGRIPVIHIKDKAVIDSKPFFAPIGEGNLDWPEILPALDSAGVEWCAVELDECIREHFDCLRSSYQYLKGFPNIVETKVSL